jgi:hypothetical protein
MLISVKHPKAKPKFLRKKEHPTLSLAQYNASNLTAKILSMIDFFMKKKWRLVDHSLGFHSHPTQTSFESLSPW